ncbi:MAG: hypothetical protein BWY42_00959 [Candidatus Omnitrophica bacterium ADurb.Bin277]|nr:MAG: hypothetical protein BWY42_00959 [Candidatus Omnitrophica bacterium ADurb.Bin277]
MSNVTVNIKLGKLENARLDLTKEMMHAADLIAQEMRGNVKAGLDVYGNTLKPNKPGYAKRKLKELGHARPLIAQHRTLVSPSSYKIRSKAMNHVAITLPDTHPRSELSVGEIGYIHQFGLGSNPVRAFAGVTDIAKKRVVAYLRDTIARLFK